MGHIPGNMPMRMLGHDSDDSGHDRAGATKPKTVLGGLVAMVICHELSPVIFQVACVPEWVVGRFWLERLCPTCRGYFGFFVRESIPKIARLSI